MIRLVAPVLVLAPSLLLGAPAFAQETGDPYAACAALPDNAARLSCFDTTYAAQGPVRERSAEVTRVETFGLSNRAAERAAERAAGPAESEAQAEPEFTLAANVSEAFEDGLGKQVLLLDNGQLWRETPGSTMRNALPRQGWQASISQSWSGAYQMRFEGKRGYLQVMRIR